MTELKPCPFCGETNDFDYQYGTEDREGTPINIYCATCGAAGPWCYTPDTEITQFADREWNTRKEPKS